jgi:hypothetical protein
VSKRKGALTLTTLKFLLDALVDAGYEISIDELFYL